jgi:hypothetical protein
MHQHTAAIHDLALRAPRGGKPPLLATVGDDRTVRFWHPDTGRMLRFARLDTVPLGAVWASDGAALIVACHDGHARAIDPDTLQCLYDQAVMQPWAYSLAVHPFRGELAIGGTGGVRVIKGPAAVR